MGHFWANVKLLAKNNYGDWWDDDPAVRLDQARERVNLAIDEIIGYEAEQRKSDPEAQRIANEMCEE